MAMPIWHSETLSAGYVFLLFQLIYLNFQFQTKIIIFNNDSFSQILLFQNIYSYFLHTMKVREDVEGVEDNTAHNYMQRSDHQHAPYNNLPPSPLQYSGSPAPLLRMCSSPARLSSSKQLGEFHWDQAHHEHYHAY